MKPRNSFIVLAINDIDFSQELKLLAEILKIKNPSSKEQVLRYIEVIFPAICNMDKAHCNDYSKKLIKEMIVATDEDSYAALLAKNPEVIWEIHFPAYFDSYIL